MIEKLSTIYCYLIPRPPGLTDLTGRTPWHADLCWDRCGHKPPVHYLQVAALDQAPEPHRRGVIEVDLFGDVLLLLLIVKERVFQGPRDRGKGVRVNPVVEIADRIEIIRVPIVEYQLRLVDCFFSIHD